MVLQKTKASGDVVTVRNASGGSDVVLVCEHASAFIPAELHNLGAASETLQSHAAWDIGAAAVARAMSDTLDAPLVCSGISRLVYDCNRPPDAADAMPAQSEAHVIPGNADLSRAAREDRVARYYDPFRRALASTLDQKPDPVVITIHSFTQIYRGVPRDTEIGILHDSDTRLADALLAAAPRYTQLRVHRNAPYGPQDGVTHTLKLHALPQSRLNVMIEIRNDLIRTPEQQVRIADCLTGWISEAIAELKGHACKG